MTDWRTIRIPEEDFERHNAEREAMDLTWAEYIDAESPEFVEMVVERRDELRKALALGEAADEQRLDADTVRGIVREEVRRAIMENV